MRAYADSHIGLVREENQDVFRLMELEGGILAAVFDGMGGVAGGRIAAELAAAEFTASFSTHCAELAKGGAPTDTDIHRLYSHAVYRANAAVLERAVLTPEWQGMGTTVCAAYLLGDVAYIAHIGDSRAYLLYGDEAARLTHDDSLVAELIARGEMTEEEAKNSRERHLLTRALGVAPYAEFHFTTQRLETGDRLLLSTDGLHALLSDREIASLSADTSISLLPKRCIEEACKRGGSDNVTVVAVEI
ncbi:MAG: serine/threonine-protein phosphatase [Clostridia bacterium]|nr:serine/threonine-protein phosphatase [Clostridia bacterium]